MDFLTKNRFLLIFLTILTFISGCGKLPKIPKPDWSKPIEPNAQKRAQQNVIDGKGIKFLGSDKNKSSGNFSFASSNPMWRATLDILDFMSIANSDYSGGLIITDWYSETDPNESIKINIRFLSNDIRADGINIKLYKRNCKNGVCLTNEINDKLVFEIKDKILKKAAIYKELSDKEYIKNRPKKVYKD
tara:strand:- start:264 stop:830 length:567 start_codon:yes stop_codon:yes gene_type:complete